MITVRIEEDKNEFAFLTKEQWETLTDWIICKWLPELRNNAVEISFEHKYFVSEYGFLEAENLRGEFDYSTRTIFINTKIEGWHRIVRNPHHVATTLLHELRHRWQAHPHIDTISIEKSIAFIRENRDKKYNDRPWEKDAYEFVGMHSFEVFDMVYEITKERK